MEILHWSHENRLRCNGFLKLLYVGMEAFYPLFTKYLVLVGLVTLKSKVTAMSEVCLLVCTRREVRWHRCMSSGMRVQRNLSCDTLYEMGNISLQTCSM